MKKMKRKIDELTKIFASNDTNALYKVAKTIFATKKDGMPQETNGEILYMTWKKLQQVSPDIEKSLLYDRFFKTNQERYEAYSKTNMITINPQTYAMGTEATTNDTYLGEVPKHNVSLSPFYASKITITKEIYKQYDPTYDNEFEQDMPAINVTWYDAAMFCLWLGCRLLTEAEWEYICRAGSPGNWCCRNEDELKQYAWYSENSHGMLHATAQLEPNQFGFYDLHGNVWEWCTDNYDEQYYAISPTDNPINTNENRNKVCRGGSYQAFSEMCRSALRYHEPAHFYSQDTGFRIAKSIPTHE